MDNLDFNYTRMILLEMYTDFVLMKYIHYKERISTLIRINYTRHTFITKAKEAIMDIEAIKLIAGHEINDVTNAVYDHSYKHQFLQEEILKISTTRQTGGLH